jgi:hypothetical protein
VHGRPRQLCGQLLPASEHRALFRRSAALLSRSAAACAGRRTLSRRSSPAAELLSRSRVLNSWYRGRSARIPAAISARPRGARGGNLSGQARLLGRSTQGESRDEQEHVINSTTIAAVLLALSAGVAAAQGTITQDPGGMTPGNLTLQNLGPTGAVTGPTGTGRSTTEYPGGYGRNSTGGPIVGRGTNSTGFGSGNTAGFGPNATGVGR